LKQLPLYPEPPLAAVETSPHTGVTKACRRCDLHAAAEKTICMSAEGEPGGVLIVGEFPGRSEDREGRPFIGETGRIVRRAVDRFWDGPVAFDNAVRCSPGRAVVGATQVDACRSYLARTLREAKPQRIIALGNRAVMSLLGRSVPIMSVRRGHGWIYNADITDDGVPVPVFMLNSPLAALRNRFIKKWLEADMRWALTSDIPDKPEWDAEVNVIVDRRDALYACDALRDAPWFSFDCETAGVMFEEDFTLVSLAAVPAYDHEIFVWDQSALEDPGVNEPLRELLGDPAVGKVGHNLKYDAHAVRCGLDTVVRNHYGDTRLWRKLLAADVDGTLDVCSELVGLGGMKAEAQKAVKDACMLITKERARSQKAMMLFGIDPILEAACARPQESPKRYAYGLIDRDLLHRYNGRDSLTTTKLGERFESQLGQQPQLHSIWHKIVKHASESIEQVEAWGIAASLKNATTFDRYLQGRQDIIRRRFDQYPDFDPNSQQSISKLLYETLSLPVNSYTQKGAPSTDKEALKELAAHHPIVNDIQEWRRVGKLRGQYAVGIQDYIRSDGRVHPSLKIDGTRSGRLSCEDPNLQNIRRPEDPESKMCRDVFVAPDGYQLVEVDYSQLELRIATMLSGDPTMMSIWESGVDYHLKTAQLIAPLAWKIKPEEVGEAERSQAKTVNFAILYGMKERTLAQRLGIPLQVAESVMAAVKGKFGIFAQWCQSQLAEARRTGYVWTWWEGEKARRRPLWDIVSQDDMARNNAENAAVNTPVQGTASEYCIASLIECVRWLLADNVPAKLVLTVHDSLMFEVKNSHVDLVTQRVPEIMTSWDSKGPGGEVPLVADLKVGPAWGSLQKVA